MAENKNLKIDDVWAIVGPNVVAVVDTRQLYQHQYKRDVTLYGVHSGKSCQGRPCIIHAPSEHIMRDLPLVWRDDIGLFERICKHGVGHPDPDDLAYQVSRHATWFKTHGCCGYGCCAKVDNQPYLF